MKRDHLLENIYDTYSPVVEGLEDTLAFFKESHDKFVKIQGVMKMMGASAKRLGQSKREMGCALRSLRYHLIRPTSEIIFDASFNIAEVLRRLGDILSKQSISDIIDLGDFFYDISPSSQAIVRSLGSYEELADAFKHIFNDSSSLLSSLQRLEAQAQTYPSDEIVVQLSEKYYQYQTVSNQMQYKASYLNYAETFIVSELNHYREHNKKHLNAVLDDYVKQNIELERSALSIIEESLDLLHSEWSLEQSFSPTQLSFGQGSPLSRGSLIDDVSQDPALGSIDLV